MARSALAVVATKDGNNVKVNPKRKEKAKLSVISNRMPKAGDNLSPEEWAAHITNSYSRSTKEMLETARLCREASGDLTAKDKSKLKKLLPFGSSELSRLTKIGNCDVFYKATNMKCIPPYVTVMYELAFIPEDELAKMFKKGDIHLNMTHDDAVELRNLTSGAVKHRKDKETKDVETKEADSDDEEVEVDDEPAAPKARAAAPAQDVDDDEFEDEDEDATEFGRRLSNWVNYIEGMIASTEPLEESMETEGVTNLPRKVITLAERGAKLLERIAKEYAPKSNH